MNIEMIEQARKDADKFHDTSARIQLRIENSELKAKIESLEKELQAERIKALRLAEQDGWISIKYLGLPKPGKFYIVNTLYDNVQKAYLYTDTKVWYFDGEKITHYQPLPESPNN